MSRLILKFLQRRSVRATLAGGLVAGSLDLLYAGMAYGAVGIEPVRILQSIASGWLGRRAYTRGLGTAFLGLTSHMTIACMAAALYVGAARRLTMLNKFPIRFGSAYGLAIFVAMNYVVVPLSAAAVAPPRGHFLWMGLLVHMYGIGVPIALFARGAAVTSNAVRGKIRTCSVTPQRRSAPLL